MDYINWISQSKVGFHAKLSCIIDNGRTSICLLWKDLDGL